MYFSRRHAAALGVLLAVALLAAAPAGAWTLPWGMKIEKIFDNSAELGNLVTSPTQEIWLLERGGNIRVFVRGTQTTNLSVSVNTTCQSGLLDAAFAPDYAQSGIAFVYYVASSNNHAKVDQVKMTNGVLSNLGTILDIAAVTDFCRPGGGLQVGKDGKLYISIGDLGTPGNAQLASSLMGKVLRANLDGSVPADNPTAGSLVWATGFRNGKGLAYNPKTARAGGTFYLTDIGSSTSPTAYDELNVLRRGGNYAWNVGSGPYGHGYDDPATSWASTALIWPESAASLNTKVFDGPGPLETIPNGTLPAPHEGSVLYACPTNDSNNKGTLKETTFTGTELAVYDQTRTLFDPAGEADGTADASCPTKVNAVSMGSDGLIYLANNGANTGIWRIWPDRSGAREVSGPGSMVPLQFDWDGTGRGDTSPIRVGWEKLPSIDVGRAKRYATNQRATIYRISEGDLPIVDGVYTHDPILDTDGTADGPMRLTAKFNPTPGSHYYLVNAQADNFEGSMGQRDGYWHLGSWVPPGPRPAHDYCADIGFGRTVNTCAREFQNESTGALHKLKDYNPRSPTYGQRLSLSDFRGTVLKLALTSENCIWCVAEAKAEAPVDNQYRDRDFLFISIFTVDYGIWHVYTTEADCKSHIESWVTSNNTSTPILCDEDWNGDGYGDVSNYYDQCNCAPQNFYIDQGGVIYSYVQGAQSGSAVISAISGEVNADGCD